MPTAEIKSNRSGVPDFRQPAGKESALRFLAGELERADISGLGLGEPAEPAEEIGARRMEQIVVGDFSGRDDRIQLFATRLDEGRHEFSYIVRATTAGTFRTAPAHAEEMYAPEVFGRTGTAIIDVQR